jgi:hypothetical protein
MSRPFNRNNYAWRAPHYQSNQPHNASPRQPMRYSGQPGQPPQVSQPLASAQPPVSTWNPNRGQSDEWGEVSTNYRNHQAPIGRQRHDWSRNAGHQATGPLTYTPRAAPSVVYSNSGHNGSMLNGAPPAPYGYMPSPPSVHSAPIVRAHMPRAHVNYAAQRHPYQHQQLRHFAPSNHAPHQNSQFNYHNQAPDNHHHHRNNDPRAYQAATVWNQSNNVWSDNNFPSFKEAESHSRHWTGNVQGQHVNKKVRANPVSGAMPPPSLSFSQAIAKNAPSSSAAIVTHVRPEAARAKKGTVRSSEPEVGESDDNDLNTSDEVKEQSNASKYGRSKRSKNIINKGAVLHHLIMYFIEQLEYRGSSSMTELMEGYEYSTHRLLHLVTSGETVKYQMHAFFLQHPSIFTITDEGTMVQLTAMRPDMDDYLEATAENRAFETLKLR